MKKILCFIAVLVSVVVAHAQWVTDSVLVGAHYRTFHFYQPQQKNCALIFALHGSGGNAKQMIKFAAKLESASHATGALVVYPEGYKRYWNECRKAATSAANTENIDENAFFALMITYFKTRHQADDSKVFAIGFSGGGHMAYKLALTMPHQFRGITAIVANLPVERNMDCGELKKPIAVMIINGTKDPVNPYNGGEVNVEGVVLGKVRSTEQTLKYWAAVNGYKGKPADAMMPDKNPTNKISIEKYSYTDKVRPDVVLYKVTNGLHELPVGMDAFLVSWEFFRQQMAK